MQTGQTAFALHGGAGDALRREGSRAHRDEMRDIATEAAAHLAAGAAALDVVERAVARLETCPLFNAGVGAVLNGDGQPELDAAVMDGDGRRFGAVAGVSRTQSPVGLARAVLERSPHVFLSGAGAEAFARRAGLPEVSPEFFVTEERFGQLKSAHARGLITLDHDAHDSGEDAAGGTVGAVARDRGGHLAAATSTGGMTNKQPGRIGDSPVPGAGTFADDASCAVSCTGTGEAFLRAMVGHQIHARMTLAGDTLAAACDDALRAARQYGGRGGLIAVDRDGGLALPFDARVMYRAWTAADGHIRVAVGPDDAD